MNIANKVVLPEQNFLLTIRLSTMDTNSLLEFTAGDGMDMLSASMSCWTFVELHVLELTGEDVGQSAENTLHEIQAKTRITN